LRRRIDEKEQHLPMQILLNGEAYVAEPGITVSGLLDQLELAGKRVAVEVNQELVPRSEHLDRQLNAGDQVEVVQAIGGG